MKKSDIFGTFKSVLFSATGLWLAAVISGLFIMNWYKTRPGQEGEAHNRWPASEQISQSKPFTYALFLHPKCKCSEATVYELQELLRVTRGSSDKLDITLYFYHPENTPSSWASDSKLWKEAQTVPNAKVIADKAGQMARKFGAETSGQTYLYNSRGELVFSGGITSKRGHIGESVGRRSIASLVTTGKTETSKTSSFGCGLFSAKEREKYGL